MSCLLKVPSGVHFTWFPGVKWILLRICSCIMKLQPYTSELRANTKCIPRAFCFSNLRSGFDFTAVFQIIMAKYNQNMVDKTQNFKHAGKDSFNLGVKSLTHYKFINSYSLNYLLIFPLFELRMSGSTKLQHISFFPLLKQCWQTGKTSLYCFNFDLYSADLISAAPQ